MRMSWASAFDLSLKTWLELLSATEKRSSQRQAKTRTSPKHRKQTRDRTLLHQCRVATLASAANKTALNSLFGISPWNVCQLEARRKGWRPGQQYLGSKLNLETTKHWDSATTRSTESCPKSNNRKERQGRDSKTSLKDQMRPS